MVKKTSLRRRAQPKNTNVYQRSKFDGRSLNLNTKTRSARSATHYSRQYKPDQHSKSELNKSTQKLSFSKVFSGFLAFTIAILLLYASSLSTDVIVLRHSESYNFQDVQKYQQQAGQVVKSNLLNRSKLLFSIRRFNQEMRNNYPEITKIQTTVPLVSRRLIVTIQTPPPLLRIKQNSNQQLYVSSNGLVIDGKKIDSSDELPPELDIQSDQLFKPKDKILNDNEVRILTLINQQINSKNIANLPPDFQISTVKLDLLSSRLEVRFKGVKYRAIFSGYGEAINQVGALKSILQKIYQSSPEGRVAEPKEYIDLRVYEKIFVK